MFFFSSRHVVSQFLAPLFFSSYVLLFFSFFLNKTCNRQGNGAYDHATVQRHSVVLFRTQAPTQLVQQIWMLDQLQALFIALTTNEITVVTDMEKGRNRIVDFNINNFWPRNTSDELSTRLLVLLFIEVIVVFSVVAVAKWQVLLDIRACLPLS